MPPVKTPKLAADPIERELDRMTERLAADLRGARGDARKEAAALRAAMAAYRAAKARMGEPLQDRVIRFFAVDGIGHKKRRTPALTAARGTAADQARWRATLDRLVEVEREAEARRAARGKKPAAKKKTGKTTKAGATTRKKRG